jgi:hypothetical protein
MAWKIRAYGSAQSISNLSFWAQLGSSKSSFEPLWLAQLNQNLLDRPSLLQAITNQFSVHIQISTVGYVPDN